jgi:F0F1-type ATP synthase epsilon subunit
MKISKQQIDIIANAMVKELRNDTKAFEEAKKEAQVYIKSFKKSKFYKELEQVFKF